MITLTSGRWNVSTAALLMYGNFGMMSRRSVTVMVSIKLLVMTTGRPIDARIVDQ